jgi:hypothetical protein
VNGEGYTALTSSPHDHSTKLPRAPSRIQHGQKKW